MNITEVPFRSSEATPPGVQVLSFDALLDRASGHRINPSAPMRPSFHHLVAVRGGRLDCSVDFTEHQLVEGDLIWVRPGQILQFGPQLETSQGIVILFAPGFLDDATASAAHADRPDASLVPVRSPALLPLTEMLADEYDNPTGLPAAIHIAIIRHVLSILLLRIGNHGHRSSEPGRFRPHAPRRGLRPPTRLQRANPHPGIASRHRLRSKARHPGTSTPRGQTPTNTHRPHQHSDRSAHRHARPGRIRQVLPPPNGRNTHDLPDRLHGANKSGTKRWHLNSRRAALPRRPLTAGTDAFALACGDTDRHHVTISVLPNIRAMRAESI
jgi:hypothetical protein